MIILEFAGRKSITQFSVIQVVVFVSIGEIALLPIYQDDFNVIHSIMLSLTMVIFLIIFEWLEMKFNWIENLLSKKALIIVDNGKIQFEELKKQRMTIDQFEMKLRLKGVTNFEELKTVTLESNGDLGFEYKDEYKPLNVRQIKLLLNLPVEGKELKGNNMFDEIKLGHTVKHDKKYK